MKIKFIYIEDIMINVYVEFRLVFGNCRVFLIESKEHQFLHE